MRSVVRVPGVLLATSVLAAGLVLSGLGQPASAEPGWFHDPLTAHQRARLVPVPQDPGSVTGPARRTRAVYTTRSGAVAVPVGWARGHQLAPGQAVTLDGRGLFGFDSSALTPGGRRQLALLAQSVGTAKAVRCEGYADYAGELAHERQLSVLRARQACAVLRRRAPGLATTARGLGPSRPAVVGGSFDQRSMNRRVVVVVTGAAATFRLTRVTGGLNVLDVAFAAPQLAAPVTGYRYSLDAGAWRTATVHGSRLLTMHLTGVAAGTRSVRVEALTRSGSTTSNALSADVRGPLGAPTASAGTYVCFGSWQAPWSPLTSTRYVAPVTGYQYSLNGGPWVSTGPTVAAGPGLITFGSPPTLSSGCLSQPATYRVRGVNRDGVGPASNAAPLVFAGCVRVPGGRC